MNEWRTSTVRELCYNIRENKDYSLCPILADALQDSGYNNKEVLDILMGNTKVKILENDLYVPDNENIPDNELTHENQYPEGLYKPVSEIIKERCVALVFSKETEEAIKRIDDFVKKLHQGEPEEEIIEMEEYRGVRSDGTEYFIPARSYTHHCDRSMTYEKLMMGAYECVDEIKKGNQWYSGITEYGGEIWQEDFNGSEKLKEFWKDFAIVTGIEFEEKPDNLFRCSC